MVVLTPIERNSPKFFIYTFHRCSMCLCSAIWQTSMRQSILFHTRVIVSHSHSSGDTVAKIWSLVGRGGTKTVSFTNPQNKKSHGVKSGGTGVATKLTRHLLFLYILSTFVASFD